VTALVLDAQRQLFADTHVIGEMFAIERSVLSPERHPGNPIMSPEMPWEGGFIDPVKVLRDTDSGQFRLWYRAWTSIRPPVERHLCYATSADGISWERPELGLVEFHGSRANNLVQSRPDMYFIHDPREPDSSRRFKAVGRFDTESLCAAFSPDGLRWTEYEANPVIDKIGDAHTLLGWDERQSAYVGYFRPYEGLDDPIRDEYPMGFRRIGRCTSTDFIHWSPMEMVLVPDAHDPVGTQFYEMYVTPYEGVYFSTVLVLHIDRGLRDYDQPNPEGMEQTIDVQLAFSRDGIHWTRLGDRHPWLALGPSQSWEDRHVYAQPLLVLDDEIRVYYQGANVRHEIQELRLSGERVEGRWRGSRVGLARLRRDGWVVARPEPHAAEAWMTTKTLTISGERLWVNADASTGSLEAEILDEGSRPLPGFERSRCVALTDDALAAPLAWRDADIRSLGGRPVRLRFYLNGASLYSFWSS